MLLTISKGSSLSTLLAIGFIDSFIFFTVLQVSKNTMDNLLKDWYSEDQRKSPH